MSITWLMPGALAGVALVALPILIHLLVRQHVRTLPYPSLRFLRQTQLAAFRRRSIQDAALLLCRAAIVAAAAVALAGPVLHSDSRQAAYASRTSRATVVTLDGVDREAIEQLSDGAFASATFARRRMADALGDAVRWLDAQPPSAREIVIAGALRRGDLTGAELAEVHSAIGIRFVPAPGARPPLTAMPVLTRRDDRLVRIDRPLRLDSDATHVADAATIPVREDLIRIVASPGDTALAGAALRAALAAGVPWVNLNQRVLIAWDGAPEAADTDGLRVIRMPVPSPPSRAADAVRDVLAGISPPALRDPVLIGADQLAAWTRSPGPPSLDAPPADEGDRRWVWGATLVLLALEMWLRKPTARGLPAEAHAHERQA